MTLSQSRAGLPATLLTLAAIAVAPPSSSATGLLEQEASQNLTLAGDPDSARVIATVSSIPLAVDLGEYRLAEAAFAPSILIDYTSLWGGEAQTMTPAALMEAWRALVPGFDATYHELRDVRAVVAGDKATATAFVDGRHWVDGRLWRPIGTYEWKLQEVNDRWQVTAMTFVMTQEIGDRGLVAVARERARLKVGVR
jgi:hypothetical protein